MSSNLKPNDYYKADDYSRLTRSKQPRPTITELVLHEKQKREELEHSQGSYKNTHSQSGLLVNNAN